MLALHAGYARVGHTCLQYAVCNFLFATGCRATPTWPSLAEKNHKTLKTLRGIPPLKDTKNSFVFLKKFILFPYSIFLKYLNALFLLICTELLH